MYVCMRARDIDALLHILLLLHPAAHAAKPPRTHATSTTPHLTTHSPSSVSPPGRRLPRPGRLRWDLVVRFAGQRSNPSREPGGGRAQQREKSAGLAGWKLDWGWRDEEGVGEIGFGERAVWEGGFLRRSAAGEQVPAVGKSVVGTVHTRCLRACVCDERLIGLDLGILRRKREFPCWRRLSADLPSSLPLR